jgi:hypothetical protein
MKGSLPLHSLRVSNQCVVVCDLKKWTGPDSSAWQVVEGSQDEVGRSVAAILDDYLVRRLDDFGGVCKTFLCDGAQYRAVPPRIIGKAAVFSFTPKNRLAAEGVEMARASSAAGYQVLIMTVQKHDKFGKIWVLLGVLRHLTGGMLTYYEDTGSIVDEIKKSMESAKITVVHVQAPGYEDCRARLADRVITQQQYQQEVLE